MDVELIRPLLSPLENVRDVLLLLSIKLHIYGVGSALGTVPGKSFGKEISRA